MDAFHPDGSRGCSVPPGGALPPGSGLEKILSLKVGPIRLAICIAIPVVIAALLFRLLLGLPARCSDLVSAAAPHP